MLLTSNENNARRCCTDMAQADSGVVRVMRFIVSGCRAQSGAVLALLAAMLLGVPAPAQGQTGSNLAITITPPITKLSVGPGETWASTLKVVNSNNRTLALNVRAMDFQATGESGRGKFLPRPDTAAGTSTHSLARWIELPKKRITVGANESVQVPFSVSVPDNAEPGGHYAAILVGTGDIAADATTGLNVSSFVSSLLLTRIQGDINEAGRIREFTTDAQLYQKQDASFTLRFQNDGNVHLQPRGSITISNMWGKQRGTIEINPRTAAGNVLPETTRAFTYSWSGEGNPFDIGRYSAVATVTYGSDSKKNTSARTSFWVIPLTPIAVGLGTILALVGAIVWMVKRYIRRALRIEAAKLTGSSAVASDVTPGENRSATQRAPSSSLNLKTLTAPIREGVLDVRKLYHGTGTAAPDGARLTFFEFLQKYWLVLVFLIIVAAAGMASWIYFSNVLAADRSFDVQYTNTEGQLQPADTDGATSNQSGD
jgi:hypothetical protein